MDEPAAVNFDPESFMSTLQSMLGKSMKQQSADCDSEDTLSGDDLSVSSEGSEASESGEASEAGEAGEGPSITQLMAEMDIELAQTEVGKTFEKAKVVILFASDGQSLMVLFSG